MELHVRRLGAQWQAQLPELPPAERVKATKAALCGKEGDSGNETSDPHQHDNRVAAPLLGAQAQQLRMAHAHALIELGRFRPALVLWRRHAAFACKHCPPFDEALCMHATHAALCALSLGDRAEASIYIATVTRAHHVAFGATTFKLRYEEEVRQAAVSNTNKRRFWKLCQSAPQGSIHWLEYVASWGFASDEIPDSVEHPS